MRWPCGPLEIEQAKRREGFTPGEADALGEWCRTGRARTARGHAGELPRAPRGRTDLPSTRSSNVCSRRSSPRRGSAGSRSSAGRRERPAAAAASAEAAGLAAIATESSEPVAGRERPPLPRAQPRRARRRGLRGVTASSGPASGRRRARRRRRDGPDRPAVARLQRLVRAARPKCLVSPKPLWLAFDPPEIGQPLAESDVPAGDRGHGRSSAAAGWCRSIRTCESASRQRRTHGARHLARDRARPRLLRDAP